MAHITIPDPLTAHPDYQLWQKRNFSRNKLLTFRGRTMPLIAWCEVVGLTEKTLRHRIERGWSVERALTQRHQPKTRK